MFYLCKIDGSSTAFETLELTSDAHTSAHAIGMLAEHPGCDYVAVWQDTRPVLIRHRRSLGQNAVGHRAGRP